LQFRKDPHDKAVGRLDPLRLLKGATLSVVLRTPVIARAVKEQKCHCISLLFARAIIGL
jgi:hypothetical protein